MSKTVKITKSQINNLINEEVARFKKIKSLENRKKEIFSQLNEMYEPQELQEIGINENELEEGVLQKFLSWLAKGYKLDGKYLQASKSKGEVAKYGTAIGRLKQYAPELTPAQAQEAVAVLLDTGAMGNFMGGSIFPTFDTATGVIKFGDKDKVLNPGAGGNVENAPVTPVNAAPTTQIKTAPVIPAKTTPVK